MNNSSGPPAGAALVPWWNGRAAGSDPGARAGRSGASIPATAAGSKGDGAVGTAPPRAQLRGGHGFAPGPREPRAAAAAAAAGGVGSLGPAQRVEEGSRRSAGRSPAGNPARPAA